ncbi:MAG: isoleucine--tRNA ligase [Deltaproteobacteria bacterium]|nr:isoleucine--tRNA ligase [Deltaproteobacteria bacterium]
MRGNLPKREPGTIRRWQEIDLYGKLQAARGTAAETFVLHDGPPYANGNIHLGHALNKVLKDIIVKFRTMAGARAPYVPGWDCHGLPIELAMEKSLGRKGEISKVEFRKLCREYASRYVAIQREEFRRLGILGDWPNPYLTMDPHYEAAEVREFGKLVENGAVYRGRKPVLWCPSCSTALAEAEVEYEEISSPSIYVAFPLAEPMPAPLAPFADRHPELVVWTTTPWTLPANLAIAVHPDLRYVVVEASGRLLVVARGRLEPFVAAIGADGVQVLGEFPGTALENARARHPWIDRDSLVILSGHVTLDAGTGLVHTAPGHGQEDYEVGLRYGLEVYAPVDAQGRFTTEVDGLGGEFVFDADPSIIARLRESGRLLNAEKLRHSYPHCWRCRNPVIFRATDQWFVSMEHGGLRRRVLEAIDRVRWIPAWGRDRIRGMMEARPDWCISRQRDWGVPIVAFFCLGCGETLVSRQIAEHVAALFDRQGGADAWFERSPRELLPDATRCGKCGGSDFRKEQDILDVWFDSGMSHVAVLESREGLRWPADLYLEGSDQHRGWFHTSLLTAVATRDRAPYEAVLTHGFTVDAEGRKMSKSAGTGLSPQDIIERHGAEILRLWVAAEDYRDDVRISQEIVGRLIEAFRRIRNTARFLIANLYDFEPARDAVSPERLLELDRWILARTRDLAERCRAAYAAYEFHVVYHALNNFCSVDLSALYLDITKDRLYCSPASGEARRSGQTALWRILDVMVRLMAPILSFTAEEIWAHVPTVASRPESVFLCDFPRLDADACDAELLETWDRLLAVRDAVTKALEGARQAGSIGHSLEACVRLGFDREEALERLLTDHLAELPTLFIVSQVEIAPQLGEDARSPVLPGLRVAVARAAGQKCARCWNYRTSVGSDAAHPTICARCVSALPR